MSRGEVIHAASEKLRELLVASLEEYHIPEHMHGGIVRYLLFGIIPGGFLQAIITNDLDRAKAVADQANKFTILLFIQWFREQAPPDSHGSQAAMDSWAAKIQEARKDG